MVELCLASLPSRIPLDSQQTVRLPKPELLPDRSYAQNQPQWVHRPPPFKEQDSCQREARLNVWTRTPFFCGDGPKKVEYHQFPSPDRVWNWVHSHPTAPHPQHPKPEPSKVAILDVKSESSLFLLSLDGDKCKATSTGSLSRPGRLWPKGNRRPFPRRGPSRESMARLDKGGAAFPSASPWRGSSGAPGSLPLGSSSRGRGVAGAQAVHRR